MVVGGGPQDSRVRYAPPRGSFRGQDPDKIVEGGNSYRRGDYANFEVIKTI